ncbi:MAG: MgtC/SapB family protein [Lachnospiraceae bacterium]|jgi:putative Mg2+ transporter-C (MgtC) family protein
MDISFDILGLGSAQAIFDQSELLLRIAIACVLGILIGNERKNRNKSAGVRTHAIVAMGSALMMVVSKYGFVDIMEYGKFDGARIAAQVVSGVGFLGAGIIFVRNNLVSGLTTSAGIWTTAGVGLAMGAGLYVIGIASALMIILMQGITHKIAHFADVASGGTIWMTIAQEEGAVKKMEDFLEKRKVEIVSTKIHKNKKDEIKLEFEVIYPPGFDKSALFSSLAEEKNVMTISE